MEKGNHIRVKNLSTHGMRYKKLTVGKIYEIIGKNLSNNEIYIINDKGYQVTIAVYELKDLELLPQDDKSEFSLNTYRVLLDEALLKNDIEWAKELHDKYIGILSK